MASLRGYVRELESIQTELKSLKARSKKLRVREKNLKGEIEKYLKEHDEHGFKYNGKAIMLEKKQRTLPKQNKQRDMDAIDVLKKYGISDADRIYEEIMNARKGEKVDTEAISFVKNKKKK